jgi:hypothetical protein
MLVSVAVGFLIHPFTVIILRVSETNSRIELDLIIMVCNPNNKIKNNQKK